MRKNFFIEYWSSTSTFYTFSQDVYDLKKNLVVYYIGTNNNRRIKVTYRKVWTKVSIQLA
jgi:hypothetical protein